MGLFAVCDFGISLLYLLTILIQIGVEFGVADRLNIKLAFGKRVQIKPNTNGLAGASINGTMKSRNGTAYPVKSSEHDLFDFGESCELYFLSLCYKGQSNFFYFLCVDITRVIPMGMYF